MDFQRSRWKSILSICGNKCTARQVAHPCKIPCRHSFILWQAITWQERFCGDSGWAYSRRSGRRLKQLENKKKRLIQEQKEQERKDRTNRLCKRMGFIEKLLPDTTCSIL